MKVRAIYAVECCGVPAGCLDIRKHFLKKYFQGIAKIGRTTHKKEYVSPSAVEPINRFDDHNGKATMISQITLYVISNITNGSILSGCIISKIDNRE
jgi:hypothetical protein